MGTDPEPLALSPRRFRKKIYDFYRRNRRDLSWRNTRDPYAILISEIMLQQTQVKRVEEVYDGFIARFPSFAALNAAPVEEILRSWQGLGYNRRALALKRIAARVIEEWGGILPEDEAVLRSLPGIGRATAAALLAFAFQKPSLLIETNIRRVFIHCFFLDAPSVSDRDILPLIERTLDCENPKDWYYALMDYGAYLGKTRENPNRRSLQYKKQPRFEGSVRQARGRILAYLVVNGSTTAGDLCRALGLERERIEPILASLASEGFVVLDEKLVRLS